MSLSFLRSTEIIFSSSTPNLSTSDFNLFQVVETTVIDLLIYNLSNSDFRLIKSTFY